MGRPSTPEFDANNNSIENWEPDHNFHYHGNHKNSENTNDPNFLNKDDSSISPSSSLLDSIPPSCPPNEKPPFTLAQLRAAIPPHCFERSLSKSMWYVTRDLIILTVSVYLSTYIHQLSTPLQLFLWPIYFTISAGTIGGLFVLTHDCCHDAFSYYPILNDFVGILLESLMFIPYIGFKHAHHKHHRFTGSYEYDNAHVPRTKKKIVQNSPPPQHENLFMEILQNNSLYHLGAILVRFLSFSGYYFIVLWYKSDTLVGKKATLLSPTPVHRFRTLRELLTAGAADLIFLAEMSIVAHFVAEYGIYKVFVSWLYPVFIFWISIGIVTFMQHTDVFVPWFAEPEWTWIRGTLSTVDRSLGPVLDFLTHDVAKYHVVHHLFPQIPFFNGHEATEAVKPILGKYYLHDQTNFLIALKRSFLTCKFVEEGQGMSYPHSF